PPGLAPVPSGASPSAASAENTGGHPAAPVPLTPSVQSFPSHPPSECVELHPERVFQFLRAEGLRLSEALGELVQLFLGEGTELTVVRIPCQEKRTGDDVAPYPAVALQPHELALLVAHQTDAVQVDDLNEAA